LAGGMYVSGLVVFWVLTWSRKLALEGGRRQSKIKVLLNLNSPDKNGNNNSVLSTARKNMKEMFLLKIISKKFNVNVGGSNKMCFTNHRLLNLGQASLKNSEEATGTFVLKTKMLLDVKQRN
jgi:hypothetical protein